MPTEEQESYDKWYLLKSPDAVPRQSFTTEEILEGRRLGTIHARAVVFPLIGTRRMGITVEELVARERNAENAAKPAKPEKKK